MCLCRQRVIEIGLLGHSRRAHGRVYLQTTLFQGEVNMFPQVALTASLHPKLFRRRPTTKNTPPHFRQRVGHRRRKEEDELKRERRTSFFFPFFLKVRLFSPEESCSTFVQFRQRISLTQAVMSCLLIVSWVIEVEYTLTAIPQLQQKGNNTEKQKLGCCDRCPISFCLKSVFWSSKMGQLLKQVKILRHGDKGLLFTVRRCI